MHENMAADVRGAACRIAYARQTISRLYGLNFECVTCNNAFKCTNIFDPYAYSSYNFYGAAICIKAVYYQKSQCKVFYRSKIF